MINNGDIFEYQEFFIFHNNSIVKFTICKTNQEILIKSNKYEAKFTHLSFENLTGVKFDNIEKEYNYFLNLFQQSSVLIKDITVNKSMTLSFIQNGKMRDIILLYNNENKSIFHYELIFEFRNLMSDIAQIKKDVHDIHNAIHNNNNINENQKKNIDNKNNIFDCNTKEYELYKNFVIDNTAEMLDKQAQNQESHLKELENKVNEYHESAKNVLKEGDKEKCKKILLKKKKCVKKLKVIEGILCFIEEQKMALDNTKAMEDVLKAIDYGNKALQKASKKIDIEVEYIKQMKEGDDNLIKNQEDLNDFLKSFSEKEEDGNMEKIEEEKKEDKKEGKKEEIQGIEDNEKQFEKWKEEGFTSLQQGVLAIIFANQGINYEGIKRISGQLDNIKEKQEKINNFFKDYVSEQQDEENEIDLPEI